MSLQVQDRAAHLRVPAVPPLRHPVASAGLGEDLSGVVGGGAQLAAESADDGAQGPHVPVAISLPHTRSRRRS